MLREMRFFGARVFGSILGQVHLGRDEALKEACGKRCRDARYGVLDLASIDVVFPFDTNGVASKT